MCSKKLFTHYSDVINSKSKQKKMSWTDNFHISPTFSSPQVMMIAMTMQILNANLLRVHKNVIKKATKVSIEFNANEQ